MPQQLLDKSPEKQQLPLSALSATRPASARRFQGELPSPILQLQRTLGNRRVAQLLQAKRLSADGTVVGLQRKLTVGAANDQYEQEADRVAHQVMSMSDSAVHLQRDMSTEEDKDTVLQTKPLVASITPLAQRELKNLGNTEDKEEEIPVQAKANDADNLPRRQPETEEEEHKPLQAKSIQAKAESQANSFEAGADVESRLNQSKGGGSPLPDAVRAFMEPRFGMEFSHVRTHTSNEAIQLNRDVGAKAFTHGSDIYYGAGQSPANLELTAHELTHVVQQTGSSPLQLKRLDETALSAIRPSVQRTCSACNMGKKEEDRDLSSSKALGSIQAKPIRDSRPIALSEYPMQRLSVQERTSGPVVQGAWNLTETVTNSSPVIGESTRGNGSTLALPLPTGVYGKAKAWQEAGFWKIYGGNGHLVMRRDTRYTFVHTGSDNNLLTLRGGASIFGGAEADDLHYGQAGAAIAGNIAVRTTADPAPKQQSLFPPIHDGGRSEAEESAIGEVDVSLPVGDATVEVKIPLTKTDEGELATLSESMPINHDVAGGGEWKSVDVYLVAYVELAADIENEFLGTDGDVNWAHATAQYNLGWQERVVPAPPDEEGGEAEILVKRRCWSARNCEGKAYGQKYSHCHNCKNYSSGKSLGEPGNCENC
ncbi:DUF4157 domain-containing protein [Nitrosovibrio tenuis]|uniref:eCIS core domain-containing protein n=1 Tax=Nitrosovibrio tenuis TaxID=1233 RepID=A0A1H7MND2_9PROT|nr:DUF4157 domain-containing protein [Nitrosovibrio tenuis]SEL12378.1 protein of unknown function [Nitrosovibrio tenuis]